MNKHHNDKKTILITGASGFLGSHLSLYYIKEGFMVIGYDIKNPRFVNQKFTFVEGNLSDTNKVRDLLIAYKPDKVLHAASLIKTDQFFDLWNVNVFGTLSLCNAIESSNITVDFILISSSAVYGSSEKSVDESCPTIPTSNYGLTKKIQETIVSNYQERKILKGCIIRPFNLIGKGLSDSLAISSFINRIRTAKQNDTKKIIVGNIKSKRDYIDVRTASAYIFYLSNSISNDLDIINICSGIGYKMEYILDKCCEKIGFQPQYIFNQKINEKNSIQEQVGCNIKLNKYGHKVCQYSLEDSISYMLSN